MRRHQPLRAIRISVNEALSALEFARLYSPIGRPLIPPDSIRLDRLWSAASDFSRWIVVKSRRFDSSSRAPYTIENG